MPLTDFYKNTSKKFTVIIQVNNVSQDISGDEVYIYFKDNKIDSTYALTSSADVVSSGSSGVAVFTLSPTETNLLNAEGYNYEIVWYPSGSNDEYVLEQSSVGVLARIEN